jgi:hypothetical protein
MGDLEEPVVSVFTIENAEATWTGQLSFSPLKETLLSS